jgi:hypothetical protein
MRKKGVTRAKDKITSIRVKTLPKVKINPSRGMVLLVKGEVHLSDGSPFAGLTVRAFDRDLRGEELLGETTTDENGQYEITYSATQFRRAEKSSADIIVRAYEKGSKLVTESQIIFNAKPLETVNLVVSR